MSADDERNALTKAQGILRTLTPSTAPNADTASVLRHASRLMTVAMGQGFSSDARLNNTRGDASNALNAVAGKLDAGMLTHDMIDRASRDVAAVLAGLRV